MPGKFLIEYIGLKSGSGFVFIGTILTFLAGLLFGQQPVVGGSLLVVGFVLEWAVFVSTSLKVNSAQNQIERRKEEIESAQREVQATKEEIEGIQANVNQTQREIESTKQDIFSTFSESQGGFDTIEDRVDELEKAVGQNRGVGFKSLSKRVSDLEDEISDRRF